MTGAALPTSVWHGSFRLFGVDVKCHVLDTGERVIEGDSMADLLEAMQSAESSLDPGDL